MKRTLFFSLLVLLFGCAVAAAQSAAPDATHNVFHMVLHANNGLAYNLDLPYTAYDTDGDTISFGDGDNAVRVSGWTKGDFGFRVKLKGRPYAAEIALSDKRLSTTDANGVYTITFDKEIALGGTTMNVPTSYSLMPGSYIQIND